MRTLLLADDSVTVQRVIALTFADEQISRRHLRRRPAGDGAHDGAAARHCPGGDDAAAGERLRPGPLHAQQRPELRDVPVLLLTGAFETVDDAQLKSSGANGIIEKPVEPTNVIGRVKELLGLKSEAKPATAGRLITSAEAPEQKKLPVGDAAARGDRRRARHAVEVGTAARPDRPRCQHPLGRGCVHSLRTTISIRSTPRSTPSTSSCPDAPRAPKPSRNPSGPLGQSSGARRPAIARPPPAERRERARQSGVRSRRRMVWRRGQPGPRRRARRPPRDPGRPARPRRCRRRRRRRRPAPSSKSTTSGSPKTTRCAPRSRSSSACWPPRWAFTKSSCRTAEPAPNAPAPASDLDFDFGLDDIKKLQDDRSGRVTRRGRPSVPSVARSRRTVAPHAAAPLHRPDAPASVMPTRRSFRCRHSRPPRLRQRRRRVTSRPISRSCSRSSRASITSRRRRLQPRSPRRCSATSSRA